MKISVENVEANWESTDRLQNDDAQDFDVRWDQTLLSANEMLSDVVLEALCKSKLQDSVQLLVVLALCDQETVRNNGQTNYLLMRTSVKLHIDQMKRTRNIRDRNDLVERGSVTQSRKRRKAYAAWKVSFFSGRHMDNVPKETLVVSAMTK